MYYIAVIYEEKKNNTKFSGQDIFHVQYVSKPFRNFRGKIIVFFSLWLMSIRSIKNWLKYKFDNTYHYSDDVVAVDNMDFS